MLDYAALPKSDTLRYLQAAQLRAMETYWHRRPVEGAPHIFDAYRPEVRQVPPPPAGPGPGASRASGRQDPCGDLGLHLRRGLGFAIIRVAGA
jgi:hypothetical protein